MVTSNLIAWNELMIKSHLSHVHQLVRQALIIVRLTSHADPLSQRMEEFAEVVQDGETHHSLNNY